MEKRGMSMPSLLPHVEDTVYENRDEKKKKDEDVVRQNEEENDRTLIDEARSNLSIHIPGREISPKSTTTLGMGSLSPQCGILMYPDTSPTKRGDGSSLCLKQREKMSLWSFIAVEFLGERHSTGLDDSVPKAIDNFLAVPARFERFVAFGLLVCLDTFLDTITLLPVRALLAAIALGRIALRRVSEAIGWSRKKNCSNERINTQEHKYLFNILFQFVGKKEFYTSGWQLKFDRARAYDLMRFIVIIVCAYILRLVPMSQAYHWIRGQNTIKLYVIIGIMEVFDRLACAFGQDAQDSLFLATRNYKFERVLLFFFVVMGVIMVHSSLLYVHITTLNVVVNASEDSAIVALLVSNNFSEIKSFVFKKYNAHNLFDVACADVCERFKICIFLSLLLALSWSQVARGNDPHSILRRTANLRAITGQAIIVAGFEIIADWLKHAFMAKFNKLDARIYDAYADRLARDVVTGRGGGIALDHTHAVTRRLGLAVLPLTCVAHRYLSIALAWLKLSLELSDFALASLCLLGFLVTLELKVLTSVLLAGVSIERHARFTKQLAAEKIDNSSGINAALPPKKKNSQDIPLELPPIADATIKSPRRASLPPTSHQRQFGEFSSKRRTSNRSSFLDDPRLNTRQDIRSPSSPRFEAALRQFHQKQDFSDDATAAFLPPSHQSQPTLDSSAEKDGVRPRAHTIDKSPKPAAASSSV